MALAREALDDRRTATRGMERSSRVCLQEIGHGENVVIRSLRKRHLATFSLLVVALPLVFGLSLSVRKEPANVKQLPRFYSEDLPFPVLLDEQEHSSDVLQITTRVIADREIPTRLRLVLTMHKPMAAPDVLIYWSRTAVTPGDALPSQAHLLGHLLGTSFQHRALPDAAIHADGNLIFYSLGHQKIMASAHLKTFAPTEGGSS